MNRKSFGWSSSNAELNNCVTEASQAMAIHNSQVRAKIGAHMAEGYFIVTEASPWFCRSTDAVVGDGIYIIREFRTRAEAEAFAARRSEENDGDPITIYPLPVSPVAVVALPHDDCPF